MFETLLECSKDKKRDKKWAYFTIVAILWVMAFSGAIITGIFFYEVRLDQQLSLITMLPALPPPLGRSTPTNTPTTATELVQAVMPINMAVPTPPRSTEVNNFVPVVLPQVGSIGEGDIGNGTAEGVFGGDPGGISGGVLHRDGHTTVAIPQPEPETRTVTNTVELEKPATTLVKCSEGVIKGSAIVRPEPIYPPLARTWRITGDVQIEITIGDDGNVIAAQILTGHPLLQQAALSAARQWKFKPTLLNNSPVKVQGIITFRFSL
jgi:protein TonB